MDIKLGRLNVTHGQIVNSDGLKSDVIRGFCLREGEVTVVATRELTEKELGDLTDALSALPSAKEKDPAEAKREQDYSKAIDKLATAAGLSKDEKDALKEKDKSNATLKKIS